VTRLSGDAPAPGLPEDDSHLFYLSTVDRPGGFIHGHTYAGNPLACAAGRAILAEITERDLLGNAERMGVYLMRLLGELKSRHWFVGDARGKGILTAIELVNDAQTFEVLPPHLNAAQVLTELCYDRGLIVYPGRTRGGYEGDHVQIGPPLNVTAAQIEEIVGILDDALTALGVWLAGQLPTF
jgi:adenosylmethionine-8-amino-7-oxononanoate aminotransferase